MEQEHPLLLFLMKPDVQIAQDCKLFDSQVSQKGTLQVVEDADPEMTHLFSEAKSEKPVLQEVQVPYEPSHRAQFNGHGIQS